MCCPAWLTAPSNPWPNSPPPPTPPNWQNSLSPTSRTRQPCSRSNGYAGTAAASQPQGPLGAVSPQGPTGTLLSRSRLSCQLRDWRPGEHTPALGGLQPGGGRGADE